MSTEGSGEPFRDSFDKHAATPEGRRGLAKAGARLDASMLVYDAMEALGLSRAELARRLGRSEATVSQLFGGDRNLTLNTLAEYLDALGYQLTLGAKPYGPRPFRD